MSQHDKHPGARPIGVFDSGLGGLTVVRRILQRRVFSRHELEESVSYKQDQAADAARQGSDDDEHSGRQKPK